MGRRLAFVSFCFAFFLVLAANSVPAIAGDVFRPVSQDELKMAKVPEAPGAPAIILYRQVDRDDSAAAGRENNYLRIKILTEEGRKYADVEIPFLKGNGSNIGNIKARTIRPDGSVVNYEGKVFDKSIVKARGLRYMAKTFTLPEVQVGSIIEYSYTVNLTEYFVFDSHWILNDELFTKNASFSLKPYRDMNCQWSWHRLPKGAEQPKEGSDHIIRMQVSNVSAFRTEDFMPPENELKARVDFTYSDKLPAKDADKFWKDTGNGWNTSLENFVGKHKAMEQAVAQIVSPNDSPEVKLQKIYARVQQLRNTSYELSKTEQEEKREKQKDLNNVEEVWKRGYGNGVQLTWLFLGLARAAGLDASGVWVSDRRNYFFNRNLMDGRKLDANVVLVKLNGKEIYCDPGAAFAPLGLLPWAETGVAGLRLDKEGGSWVQTTLPLSSESRIDHKATLNLTDDGSLEGQLSVTFSGLEAMRLRVDQRHTDDAGRKKFLEDAVKEHIPAAAEVELTNKPDWGSSTMTLVAEYSLKIPGWVSGAGRRAMLPVGIFSAMEKRVFDHAERVHPIYFEFPFAREDDVSITLPLGWEVSSLPEAQTRGGSGSAVLYELKAQNDRGTLHLRRRLAVDVLLMETKYYPALRAFFQAVRTGDEEQVVLQPIGTKASK